MPWLHVFLQVFLLNAAVKVFMRLCSGENNSAGISTLMPQLNYFCANAVVIIILR